MSALLGHGAHELISLHKDACKNNHCFENNEALVLIRFSLFGQDAHRRLGAVGSTGEAMRQSKMPAAEEGPEGLQFHLPCC